MLAHVETVRHAHPHPAGVSWEVIALLIAVALVAGAFAAWWTIGRDRLGTAWLGRPRTDPSEGHDHG